MTKGASKPTRVTSWRARILLGYTLVIVLLFGAGLWALFVPLTNAVIDNQEANLDSVAHADSLVLAQTDKAIDAATDELASATRMRITVIARDGTVLADSETDPATMDNHAGRPEVASALSGKTGFDRRTSATEKTEQLYVAVPSSYQGDAVVLRVSTTAAQVIGATGGARLTGILLLAAAFLLSIVVVWRMVLLAARPVDRLETVRSDFVANASHELKTPIAGIRLLSETMELAVRDNDIQTARELAARIDGEAERLQHLLGDLLDLSRLESSQELRETTDARSSIIESVQSHQDAAEKKGLALTFVDEALPADTCRVALSRTDLRVALDNLISNAINYTDTGSVTVRLACDEQWVDIAVEDTGIGIETDVVDRIFERFYRTDEARKRAGSGTGLGLALVKHAVERSGGTLGVTSTPRVGAVFTMRLAKASGKPSDDTER